MTDVKQLVSRLRAYNEWRRGAETEQPDPTSIGLDIDAACNMLESMSDAISRTVEEDWYFGIW